MNYLVRGIDNRGHVKIVTAITTELVEEARRIHNTSKTASAALGRTLTGTLLLATNMKNDGDTMTVNIKGDGELGRIIAVAGTKGIVKGYVDNPLADAEIRESDGKLDVAKIVGKGNFTVVMDLGLKKPYSTSMPIVSGEIGQDFANYLYHSDQVPSVFGLGVLVDVDYTIKAAGGFMVQLMPDALEEDIVKIEENLKTLPNISTMVSDGMTPEEISERVLEGFQLEFLDTQELSFKCDCNREKIEGSLYSIGEDELTKIIEEDKGAEVVCYFCNKKYHFNEEELEEIKAQHRK